jgi:hypothetical protein
MGRTPIKHAKAGPSRSSDGTAMEIVLTDFPYRGEWWTFNYVFGGKQKTLSLGTYPLITLMAAPTKHDEMHQQLANGVGPGALRTATKAAQRGDADGFEVVARKWFEVQAQMGALTERAHSPSIRG